MLEKQTTTPTAADTALGDALLGKLRELAALRPTVRSLMQLEHTARLAREILVAALDPYALKRNKMQGIQASLMANSGAAFEGDLPYTSGPELVGESMSLGPLAGSSIQENFGAQILRELGASKGESSSDKPSALDLVAAISFCREKGMNDLAGKLEDTLLEAAGHEKASSPGIVKTTAPALASPEAAQ